MHRSEYLDVPGGRLAYDVQGEGPLVVCVPSMGDVRAEYRFLAPRLATDGFRVATLDVRGHGESSTGWPDHAAAAVGGDVIALVRRLGGPALVVGDSMGAAAAVWAAAEATHDIAGLVLAGPIVRDLPSSFGQRLAVSLLLRRPWGPRAWAAVYERFYPSTPPDDLGEHRRTLRANLAEPGRFEALRAMAKASKADCEARLDDVRTPALVVMGTADPDFPDATVEAHWLRDRLHAELLLLDGVGHYPHAERPDEVAPAVAAFAHRVFAGSPCPA